MRVIAGTFKSRRLRTLRGMALRPTSDRLRETLFDVLGDAIEDCLWVDLFAGTGAVGIEAISRGARRAVFIETDLSAVQLIHQNLKSLGISGEAEVFSMDAIRGLERLASGRATVDFIFLDPPYAQAHQYRRALEFIGASGRLSATGRVIAEHREKLELPLHAKSLERMRVLKQGDSALSFYRMTRPA